MTSFNIVDLFDPNVFHPKELSVLGIDLSVEHIGAFQCSITGVAKAVVCAIVSLG